MAGRCERCGQAVMEGDSECWHCGAKLKPTAVPTPLQPARTKQENTTAPDPQSVSLAAVAYYAVAAAVTLLLLIWLIRSLNWRPLIQLNPDIARPSGWTAVTDPDYQYTFNLPPMWVWAAEDDEQTAESFSQQRHLPQTQAILASWAPLTENIQPKLLAATSSNEPFLFLVAVGPPTSAAALYEAVQTQPAMQLANQTSHYLGYEQVSFSETIEANGLPWLCRVRIHVAETVYWIATCGSPADMSRMAHNITLILDSFQPLAP